MRSRHVILILSAIIANLAATSSRAGLILGQIMPRSPRIFVDRSGTPLPLTPGNFSAHAGANVGGRYVNTGGRWVLTGGTTDSQHVPVQTGAANTTFPADYIQIEPNPVKYAPAKPLGITYASTAKDVDGEANGAMASVTAGGTTASANTIVSFRSAPGNRFTFDPTLSTVTVTRPAGGPPGTGANMIYDPLFTPPVNQGDVLTGAIDLSASTFSATINNEPDGILMSSITIGSTFPTTPIPGASAPGLDDQGNPIVIELALNFTQGNLLNPSVGILVDPSYRFLNPDTLAPIDPSQLEAFVTNRLDSMLTLDSSGNTVRLTGDVTLLDWAGTAVQNGSIAELDINAGQLAATDVVPEPATLVPALSGVALLGLGYARRRRRSAA
jgi:hypothetical protein